MRVSQILAAPKADATSRKSQIRVLFRAQQRAPPCCKSMTWKEGDWARGLLRGLPSFLICPLQDGQETLRPPPLPPVWCPIQPSRDSLASFPKPGSPFRPGPGKGNPLRVRLSGAAQLPAQERGAGSTLFAHPNPKYSVTRGGTSSCTLASGHRCGCTPRMTHDKLSSLLKSLIFFADANAGLI